MKETTPRLLVTQFYHLDVYLPGYLLPFFGEIEYNIKHYDILYRCEKCDSAWQARLRIDNPGKYLRPPLLFRAGIHRREYYIIYFCQDCHHIKRLAFPVSPIPVRTK